MSKWSQLRRGKYKCFCFGCGKVMLFREKLKYPELLKCSTCGVEFLAIKGPEVRKEQT